MPIEEELFEAVAAGDSARVKAALQAGADPNALDDGGHSPLFWASFAGRRALARILTEKGARVDAERPQDGSTSVHAASARGDVDLLDMLMKVGGSAVLERFDDLDRTPLMKAVESGAIETVQTLLSAGAKVDTYNEPRIGETALHHAVREGKIELVRILLNAGANPRIEGWMRQTPLDLALSLKPHGHRQIIVLLENDLRRRASGG